MRWWKWLGLAGVVGVAASGVVVARSERRRRAYTPEEIRSRLHARVGEGAGDGAGDAADGGAPMSTDRRGTATGDDATAPAGAGRGAWWRRAVARRRGRPTR